MIFSEHKHRGLANEIEKEYVNLCSKQACASGECKYALQTHCKTLFILDYLDKKDKQYTNKYKECLKGMTKEDILNVERLLEECE